jgi:hypothetical protein
MGPLKVMQDVADKAYCDRLSVSQAGIRSAA